MPVKRQISKRKMEKKNTRLKKISVSNYDLTPDQNQIVKTLEQPFKITGYKNVKELKPKKIGKINEEIEGEVESTLWFLAPYFAASVGVNALGIALVNRYFGSLELFLKYFKDTIVPYLSFNPFSFVQNYTSLVIEYFKPEAVTFTTLSQKDLWDWIVKSFPTTSIYAGQLLRAIDNLRNTTDRTNLSIFQIPAKFSKIGRNVFEKVCELTGCDKSISTIDCATIEPGTFPDLIRSYAAASNVFYLKNFEKLPNTDLSLGLYDIFEHDTYDTQFNSGSPKLQNIYFLEHNTPDIVKYLLDNVEHRGVKLDAEDESPDGYFLRFDVENLINEGVKTNIGLDKQLRISLGKRHWNKH